jgi:methionyl-tRNA formyltransferase
MSLRILLLAEEAAGMQTLRLLHGTAHRVVAVMTGDAQEPARRATVHDLATRLGHRVWPLRLAKEAGFAETIRLEHVDVLLNVHALVVLPAAVVAAPRVGSFNLHPGPLPQYAGLNTPSWAIYHGERTHAVTVHWMDAGIDTGPFAFEAPIEITDGDTGFTLSAKCVRAGVPLLRELLAAAAAEPPAVPRRPQPDRPRRYFGREVPYNGHLVWTEPAVRVVNFVRASDYSPFASPWGHPRATLAGREMAILQAARTGIACDAAPGTVGDPVGTDVLVAAGDEWVLIRRVRVGATSFSPADVLRSGQRFDSPQETGSVACAAR